MQLETKMEIEILGKVENLILNRIEIAAEINHEGKPTPTRAEIRKQLAAELGADENLLVIKKIETGFGTSSKCDAILYKSREELEKTEAKYILKREEKSKPKEAPKEEPKEEAKLEEKKEEKPEEAKPEEPAKEIEEKKEEKEND